ncbi:MAG: shikimate kinase [Desulfobacterales bacterium]
MKIVLIGYRGTGKSAVGVLLAEKLGMPCVHMDDEIVKTAGMSIPEIVGKFGWKTFRDMESAVVRLLAERDNLVIDTGGGVIERPENVANLRNNATVFWLRASVPVIVSRIEKETQRPALTPGMTFTEEVAAMVEKRAPKYEQAADVRIDTDDRTPEQVADTIVRLIET